MNSAFNRHTSISIWAFAPTALTAAFLLCFLFASTSSFADTAGGIDAGAASAPKTKKQKKPKKVKTAKPSTPAPTEPASSDPGNQIATQSGSGGLVTGVGSNIKKLKIAIDANGTAEAPAWAPPQVLAAVAAANDLVQVASYSYGASHASYSPTKTPTAVDCSSAAGYPLYKANLLASPLDSVAFYKYGEAGPGRFFTIWTKSSHAFLQIGDKFINTSRMGKVLSRKSGSGPVWSAKDPTAGYRAVHPSGF